MDFINIYQNYIDNILYFGFYYQNNLFFIIKDKMLKSQTPFPNYRPLTRL
jgi:hypothetical protein